MEFDRFWIICICLLKFRNAIIFIFADDENKNILNNNKFLESLNSTSTPSQGKAKAASEILDKFTRNEFSKHHFHSPKVFTADTVTVNTSAKDVLGPKYNNFTKNLNNSSNNNNHNNNNNYHHPGNYTNLAAEKLSNKMVNGNGNGSIMSCGGDNTSNILTMFNNLNGSNNGGSKVQNSYDRYPKSRGGLQVFPMNGVNEQINNNGMDYQGNTHQLETQRQRAQSDRLREQEMSRAEQDRLEEILQLCAEYERQNSNSSASSNITNSPIVQNRIKTNGSLPRDKKSPFGSEMNSPFNDKNGQVFFPSDEKFPGKKSSSSGYENVTLNSLTKRVEVSSRYENVGEVVGGGAEDYPLSPKKSGYVPQSPRTKIRTTCSPSPKPKSVEVERKAEYDLLMQSFEDRQRMENLKNNSLKYSDAEKRILDSIRHHSNDSKNQNLLQQERYVVLTKVRELKTQIADLQRQEDEVLREVCLV